MGGRPGSPWTNLAPVYDRIFPPGRAQLDFVTAAFSRMARPARRVLDAGCGTGGYALALAEAGFEVTGVDLDPEMVRVARERSGRWAAEKAALHPGGAARHHGPEPRFETGDIADLSDLPGGTTRLFDGIICLGNTLAHMLSAAELGRSLGEMARLIRTDGRAVMQTVNYDRLEATGQARFPPIPFRAGDRTESDESNLVLHRLYLPRADGLVTFVTSVREAGSDRSLFRSESLLRPVFREELETIARMAFHGPVEVYGDFLFSQWTEASPATVVVASRGGDDQ